MPPAVPMLSETGVALCMIFILLVPFALIGLSLINTGLGRSRSAAHSMLSSLCVVAVAAIVYFVLGFALEGFAGRPAHVLWVAGKPWNWLAAEPFFFRGLAFDASPASLAVWLQVLSVGLAALIPVGSGGERWRLGAACASTAILAGWTYPLFAHWTWGGGWLAQLGANYGLGHGFVDAGGAGSIQVLGGVTALAIAWILGPRRGKYALDGMPMAIPGHNTVLVLLGCLLAWVGWIGLNCAGAVLFRAAEPGRAPLIAINTTLAAASAALVALAATRIRFGKPDTSLTANGWVAGLVSICAACAFIRPAAAVLVGAVAGVLVTYAVEWLERLTVDDPAGAISVHALGGIWGLLAVWLFARMPEPLSGGESGQWLAQLLGIATLLGLVLPMTYCLNLLLDRILPQRVALEGERQGMDLHELGGGAYPEFTTHSEELFGQH